MQGWWLSWPFLVGAGAVAYSLGTALFNVGRLFYAHGNHLIVDVGSRRFVIDVSSPNREEIEIIDSATRALEDSSADIELRHRGGSFVQNSRHAA